MNENEKNGEEDLRARELEAEKFIFDILPDHSEFKNVFNPYKNADDNKKFEKKELKNKNSKAITRCFADIKSEPINWLWEGRIALGKITMIVGDPSLGKSLLTATLAGCVSKGFPFPVDKYIPPIGDVILLSAEDDPADTIKPRLEAMGADCKRIHILEAIQETDNEGNLKRHSFSFKRDLEKLEELLISLPDCRLIIIDPISAYLDGTDSNTNSDIRGLLAPFTEVASRYKVAVVLISHLNKNSGQNAMYRTTGSLAFVAVARSAYLVTKDKDNPERRLFMPLKNNIAKDTNGLAYSIMTAENGSAVIVWESEFVTITADEALAVPESNEERNDTDEATDFLKDLLVNGAVKVFDLQKEAREAGIKEKALRRAREKLSVKKKKVGFNPAYWICGLTEDALNSEEAQYKKEGILGDEGHLRETKVDGLSDKDDGFGVF